LGQLGLDIFEEARELSKSPGFPRKFESKCHGPSTPGLYRIYSPSRPF
jgi:hypothetical protein